MICRQCGAEVPEGQPVCPYCGTKMMMHLSDNDIERLANTPSIPEEPSGAHFATPSVEDADLPVVPDEAIDDAELVHADESPAAPTIDANEQTSTVIYGSENTLPETQPSVAAPVEASPERRRLERMVRRAKRRSWIQAARRGIEQQDRPHIHVHDNNQSLSAFRLSEPEEHQDWLRRKRLIAGVIACVLVVLLGIGIAFGTWQAELWGGHTIDDVRGMTSTDATARLVADGFQVVLAEEPSENSVGVVVSMSPNPGVRADKGTTVTIYVGVNQNTASPDTAEGSDA